MLTFILTSNLTAQIYITNATKFPQANQLYNLGSYYGAAPAGLPDPGTSVYTYQPGANYVIVRKSVKWRIEENLPVGSTTIILYIQTGTSTANTPPSTLIMEAYNGGFSTIGFPVTPPVQLGIIDKLNLFGEGITGGSTTTGSVSVYPSGIAMAQLTNAEIDALPSPTEGYLVYNIEEHCLMVFSSGCWTCLTSSKSNCPAADGCCTGKLMAQGVGGISGPTSGITHSQTSGSEIYITGFTGTLATSSGGGTQFVGGLGSAITGFGQTKGFLAKFDANQNLIWLSGFGNTGLNSDNCFVNSVRINNSDIYITGYFSGTLPISTLSGTTTLTATDSNDAFVAKLNSAGNVIWAVSLAGTGDDRGVDLEFKNPYLYVVGNFNGTFGIYSPPGNNVFISKIDPFTGSTINTSVIGSTVNNYATSILTHNNNLFISGYSNSACTLANGSINVSITGSYSGTYAYIANLDLNLVPNTTNNSVYSGTSGLHSAIPTRMVKATINNAGSMETVFRLGLNTVGNFSLGGENLLSKAAVLSVQANNTSSIAKIFGIQYAKISAIDEYNIAGKIDYTSANVNNCFFSNQIGESFLMSINNKGEYNGAINTNPLYSPSGTNHTPQAISTLCNKVHVTGAIKGLVDFCGQEIDTSIKSGLNWWTYSDSATLNCN